MCDSKDTITIEELNSKLKGKRFVIPGYQRGYRWNKENVVQLLEDILDYKQTQKDDEIYCIQPLVVKKQGDDWEVVDGQQRLTTIYLILGYLQRKLGIADEEKIRYSIKYDTRDGSESFLNKLFNGDPLIDDEGKIIDPESYIDFFHMNEVNEAIASWFETKCFSNEETKEYYQTILTKVNFIWYVLGKEEKPTDVFSRLNEGRIALTEAELIKALFLNGKNFENIDGNKYSDRQLSIALEWDSIENSLQNDEFWLFIHNREYKEATRIDFIFSLVYKFEYLKYKGQQIKRDYAEPEKHKTLEYFKHAFASVSPDDKEKDVRWLTDYWNNVKNLYKIFQEWFNDYKLYHYVGYYIAISKDEGNVIDVLMGKWMEAGMTKTQFEEEIVKLIISELAKEKWIYNSKDETEIKWNEFVFDNGDNENTRTAEVAKTECVHLLLLHNIETIIVQNDELLKDKKKNFTLPNFTRFPFHLYKNEKWEVEHIYPNSGDKTNTYDSAMTYLWYMKQNTAFCEKIEGKYHNELDGFLGIEKKDYRKHSREIDEFISKVNELFIDTDLKGEGKNTIKNYTLLDQETNGSYQNWIFPIKRLHITKKEDGKKPYVKYDKTARKANVEFNSGVAYILPCTKNVFTKAYSNVVLDLFSWTDHDAECYENDIYEKLYEKYIKPAEDIIRSKQQSNK